MIDEIADIVTRARATAMEDALGVLALFALLFAGFALTSAL